MRKALIGFLTLLLSIACTVSGQCQVNLVLNGSFEKRIGCTASNTVSSLLSCQDWDGLHGSPDYFHRCASAAPWWSVPNNVFGTQLPSNSSDSAYAGVSTFTTWFPGGQESLEGALSEPLNAGVKYRVRMKASIASGLNYTSCCVGIAFSPPPFPPYTENLCDVELRIPANQIDLSVWYQLDTVFTAQGGEQEFYIGNFRPDEESYPVIMGDTTVVENNAAYFYIDDVEIYEDTITGIAENGLHQVSINVDPISQRITVLESPAGVVMKLYDMAGKLLAIGGQHLGTSGLTGFYVVRVMDRNGNLVGVKKVVLGL